MLDISKDVPIVDLGGPGTDMPDAQTCRQIDRACRRSGFFYIANHGLEAEFLDEVWSVTRWFFGLPLEQKLQVQRSESNPRGFYNRELTKNIQDMKEIFDFGHKPAPKLADNHPENLTSDGWNQWPKCAGADHFRSVLEEYYKHCGSISLKLLQVPGDLGRHHGAAREGDGDVRPHLDALGVLGHQRQGQRRGRGRPRASSRRRSPAPPSCAPPGDGRDALNVLALARVLLRVRAQDDGLDFERHWAWRPRLLRGARGYSDARGSRAAM